MILQNENNYINDIISLNYIKTKFTNDIITAIKRIIIIIQWNIVKRHIIMETPF